MIRVNNKFINKFIINVSCLINKYTKYLFIKASKVNIYLNIYINASKVNI